MEFLWGSLSTHSCESTWNALTGRVKAILSVPLTKKDVQLVDVNLYRGVNRLKELVRNSEDEDLGLYFSVDITNSNEVEEIDLIPNGRNRRVSSENVGEYSDLMIKHYLFDNYKNSLYYLLNGIFEVIPQEYFSIFTESELKTVLEGEKKIDVNDWRHNTVYTNEFCDQHPVVNAFWRIVSRWSCERQSLLLCFATGYRFPPVHLLTLSS